MASPPSSALPREGIPPELSAGGQAILGIAEALFAEKGFEGTSMSEVARRAGVSKANVFHHFGNKRGLYLAVIRAACSDSREALLQACSEEKSVGTRLAAFQSHHLGSMLRRSKVTHLVIREVLESTPERAQELTEQVFAEGFEHLVATIREGQQNGEFRPELDAALLASVILSANVFFFQSQELLRHFPHVDFADDPARYTALVTDLLLNGCRKPPETGSR